MIQLGKTSLLVYWVHIEFRLRSSLLHPPPAPIDRPSKPPPVFSIIFLAMLLLSLLRTNCKRSPSESAKAEGRPWVALAASLGKLIFRKELKRGIRDLSRTENVDD